MQKSMFDEEKFLVSPIVVAGMSPEYRQKAAQFSGLPERRTSCDGYDEHEDGDDLFPLYLPWYEEDFKGIFLRECLRADHLMAVAIYARAIRWNMDGFPHSPPGPRVVFIRTDREGLEKAPDVLVKGYTYIDLPHDAPKECFFMMNYQLPEGAQLTPFGRAWARLKYSFTYSVDGYKTGLRRPLSDRAGVIHELINDFGLVMNQVFAFGVCSTEAGQLIEATSPEIKNLHRLLVEAEKLGLEGFEPSDDEFKNLVGRIELALLSAIDALIADV